MAGYLIKNSKSMRLTSARPFEVRNKTYQQKEPHRIYIIFSEGVATEQIYLHELSKSKRKKENIQIYPVNRWRSAIGHSNQYQLVLDIIEYINHIQNISPKDKKKFRNYYNQITNGCDIITLLNISESIKKLVDKYPNILSHVDKIQEQLLAVDRFISFDKNYDKIIVLIDRDRKSFTTKQFHETIQLCNKNKFTLCITNPCFEFYLLCHLNHLQNIDYTKLAINEKIGNETYIELLLNQEMKSQLNLSFQKNNYDPSYFINHFEKGYKNISQFSTKNEELENQIGSSLFDFISEVIDTK